MNIKEDYDDCVGVETAEVNIQNMSVYDGYDSKVGALILINRLDIDSDKNIAFTSLEHNVLWIGQSESFKINGVEYTLSSKGEIVRFVYEANHVFDC